MNGRARKAAVAATAAILGCAMAQPAHAMRVYVNYDSLVISAGPGEINLLDVRPHPTTTGVYVVTDPGANIKPGAGCTGTPLGRIATCTFSEEYSYFPPALSLSLGDWGDVATVSASFRIMQVDSGWGDDRLDLPGSFYNGYTYVDLGRGNDTLKLGGTWDASVEVRGGEGDDTIEDPGTPGGYYYGDAGADKITANGWVSGGEGADTLDGTGSGYGWDHYFGDAGDDSIDTDDFAFDVVDCGDGTDTATPDETDELSNCEG